MLSYQEIADGFAISLYRELAMRDIPILAPDTGEKQTVRSVIAVDGELEGLKQLHVCFEDKTEDRKLDLRAYLTSKRNAILELGCKLARPFPVKFAHLDNPLTVHASALAEHKGVCVRVVSDYLLSHDLMLLRLDCLCAWKSAEDDMLESYEPGLIMEPKLS